MCAPPLGPAGVPLPSSCCVTAAYVASAWCGAAVRASAQYGAGYRGRSEGNPTFSPASAVSFSSRRIARISPALRCDLCPRPSSARAIARAHWPAGRPPSAVLQRISIGHSREANRRGVHLGARLWADAIPPHAAGGNVLHQRPLAGSGARPIAARPGSVVATTEAKVAATRIIRARAAPRRAAPRRANVWAPAGRCFSRRIRARL